MSEADRVFPRDPNQPQGGESRDRRVIVKSPRRNGPGGGTSRTVEVVHVRRGAPRPADDQPRAASRHTHAETWPDGFRAKPPRRRCCATRSRRLRPSPSRPPCT
jgi:hypothetical protein